MAQRQEILEKIAKEKQMLQGTRKMMQQATSDSTRKLMSMSIVESEDRLKYLESQLNNLSLDNADSVTVHKFAHLVRQSLSTSTIKSRLINIERKIKLHQQQRSKLESTFAHDPKIKQLREIETLLGRAKARYSSLVAGPGKASFPDDKPFTGILRMKLIVAENINKSSSIEAHLLVNDAVRYRSRPTLEKWNEFFEIELRDARDLEIRIVDSRGTIVAFVWFTCQSLLEYAPNNTDIVLDLEPGGHMIFQPLLLNLDELKNQNLGVKRDRAFVNKIFPKNGHSFVEQEVTYMQYCSLCNEQLDGTIFRCQECSYGIHPRCYQRVITTCIPLSKMDMVDNKNTGKLLKYNIPHRWDTSTVMFPVWCSHCSNQVSFGKKIHRCTECDKTSHKECSPMIPNFCGLLPKVADQLVAAFEEHERKMLQKQIIEAEKQRIAALGLNNVPTSDDAASPTSEVDQFRMSQFEESDTLVDLGSVGEIEKRVPTLARRKTQFKSASLSIDDFHFVAVLGRGAFGKVMLANEKKTDKLYAIKALKKQALKSDDIESMKIEKKILQMASSTAHPFLVNLHSSFHTDNRVFFVMEYISGGDLMYHLQERGRFSQHRTRFYACEILLGLQYLHANDVIYRDMKLENTLLGPDGHLKLADYGICKTDIGFGQTTNTFVGTPDYMAPEVLSKKPYGKAVDWWSFGVLLYVMLCGKYPFHYETEREILLAINRDSISFPPRMGRITLSLLKSLMNKDPVHRLGAGETDAEEVKAHPYFANVDWNALLEKELPPPMLPKIVDERDTSNFDPEFTSEQPVLTPIRSTLDPKIEKEFSDFSYIADWALQERIAAAYTKGENGAGWVLPTNYCATKLLQAQNSAAAKQMVEMSILESKGRLEFLEGELKKLALKEPNLPTPVTLLDSGSKQNANSPNAPQDSSPETHFDYLKYGTNITSDLVKFRLKEVLNKLAIEKRVRTGTENLVAALGSAGIVDPKRKTEAENQLADSKAKQNLLLRSKNRYAQLNVGVNADENQDQDENMLPVQKKTGLLKFKLIGAANLTERKSLKDEIRAVISIDGIAKYTSRETKTKWDETIDIQVDKANEVEIAIHERGGQILALVWFKISDLENDIKAKYNQRPTGLDVNETWLELEPSGQLLMKLNFIAVQRSKTHSDQVFRRNAVQKLYPRNGHLFVAKEFYQVLKCALCNEFLGRQGYCCQGCNYTIHPKCYGRVITKCITAEQMATAEDKNTGQLLKYKIPHRWDNATVIGPSWCGHCGFILTPGKKINRCTECSKSSHKECTQMIPFFCGLAPEMADTLVAAFEEHEKKIRQKEIEEAEKARLATPVFEASELNTFATTDQSPLTPNAPSEDPNQSQKGAGPRSSSLRPPNQQVQPTLSVRKRGEATGVNRPLTRGRSSSNAVNPLPALPTEITYTIDDFHFIAVLGRGAFGKVMLATEKTTQKMYAIKALKKDYIIQNDDLVSLRLEKSIFKMASKDHHPFLLNLHSSFHTEGRVYFVMEYIPGGDLMCHIQDKKRFSSSRTRFYACELDNLLLGADGHIKVADYGICKENMPYGATTATFCGTSDYMAPEILMHRKYGVVVDWWSFGVLIYVMLIGRYPFHGESEEDILDAILADAIEYPSNMPRVTLSLLQSLMNKNPARRLGAGIGDAEEVKKHPYFTAVDWERVYRKDFPPPMIPLIKDATDVSNFDKEFTSEAPVLTPINSVLNAAHEKEFEDFTYISDWAFQERCAGAIAK